MHLSRAIALTLAVCAAGIFGQAARAIEQDPYIWLEDVSSPRAMAWVNAENIKTLKVLEGDPRYPALYADALAIAQAKDRIPTPSFLGGEIYNFWQDVDHVRGIWRRTTLADYRSTEPKWQTVLDLDELAGTEKANWFLKGVTCAQPTERRCMLDLSDGGEDAVTVREFDVKDGRFISDGFVLPHGKQTVAWDDDNTLFVSREWSPGELTTSGYPFVVKRVKRGLPLSAATEVFRGSAKDGGYGVSPIALNDGEGHHAVIIQRPLSTFEAEYYIVTPNGVRQLALPEKLDLQGMVSGQVILSINQGWSAAGGMQVGQGSLVAIDLKALLSDPEHLTPVVIYSPGPRETFKAAQATRDALIVTTLDNVKGKAAVYRRAADGAWTHKQLALLDNAAIDIVDTDLHGGDAFLNVSGFLDPTSLVFVGANSGNVETIKSLPPKFDASNAVVEQFEATSSDGTQIPYFVVHRKDIPLDGSNPTIMTAYGGFQVSRTPFYLGTTGKLWLERGGVFVLANIRGGGEFGPAWHDAGLKTHRQIIYDDFAAIARDLVSRKITTPRRLGIEGGSNGGLLMGVEFTQHPELWNAVDIQVPLLDMLRFEQIAAGTSWVGEYGSVSVPAERAFLASISPYANIKKGGKYPEPFIWTTTKDDRVGPQHARKFAARLSEYGIPYLFYEVTEGGHGSGANLKEKAHTTALEMTYFARKLMD